LEHPYTRLLPVWRSNSLVRDDNQLAFIERQAGDQLLIAGETPIFLGVQDDIAYFAVDISDIELPAFPLFQDHGDFRDLRQIGSLLPREDGALLAYARAMVHWHRTHLFCSRCGSRTRSVDGGHVRRCNDVTCATDHYPRTDSAVIMLVSCGDYCLLGRQAAWPPGMMSALAGFLEPGETPEEAVRREVMEEVGVALQEVRYHSSQPWPFPGSLMIGFTATTARCAPLKIDHHEIEEAGWFSRSEIAQFAAIGRPLPNPHSIARRLIEDWLAN
jgi:NAD+ diphosphatase